MKKTKEQKAEILTKLRDGFKNAASTVFVHFNGLKVSDEGEMRSKLKEDGVSYFVARKTLIKKALEESEIKGEAPAIEGEIAVAYNSTSEGEADPTLPARSIQGFSKTLGADALSIVGGIYEGKFLSQEKMLEIAQIPPLPQLRGMFVNVINSPIQGLVIALNQIAEKKNA